MSQLDKTFPTLDCSACILTPKMVDAAAHEKIKIYTYSEVEKVSGFVGDFTVDIRKKADTLTPRSVRDADFARRNVPPRSRRANSTEDLTQEARYTLPSRRQYRTFPLSIQQLVSSSRRASADFARRYARRALSITHSRMRSSAKNTVLSS